MKISLSQLHEDFVNECRYSSKLSEETLNGYISSFKLFSKIMPETSDPSLLSPKIMIEFFKRLENRKRVVGRGKIKIGIKKTTVATYWSKLNVFMKWLKKGGYIEENPFSDMDFPYVRYDDRKFLKKEDLEKILTAVDFNIQWANSLVRKRNVAIVFLLLATGLRRGELLGLRVFDLDINRKQLTVKPETSKSKIERVIPLNSMVIPKLRDYIEERKKREYATPYFFVSCNKDSALTQHGLKHLIEKIKHASGTNFHLHQLRHTFAVNLINGGSDVSKVKQLMGHKDIRMTAAYLRCIPTKAIRNDVEMLTLDNLI